ncbi:MAG: hypothetical protein QXK37_03035 [Candidatus Woesearchaeota archaeon]
MTSHHIFKERDLKERCLYCSRELDMDNFKSVFNIEKHYKIVKCDCGKTTKVTVGFVGSGHDTWSKPSVEPPKAPLEVQVKALSV